MNSKEGEEYLLDLYSSKTKDVSKQVHVSTTGCLNSCNLSKRIFDVVADGVAHESKVGAVAMSPSIRKQIESDAWLIKNGDIKGSQWHFFPSDESSSIGAADSVLALLKEHGIPYTIHLPSK